ncbi:DUF4405 domain-containing protein [Noviherbaspirillum sp. UKPF54]|uniref:DUF4405 domain-containing protein n=1 Tax=Noviherbaspirillum sp. UKPF54 TaxID=2601898 RepID=UPI0011B1A5C0|nr:DUF4405 domain-containing protein [Noviherbaspirillum sp. UKPF54]QDZ27736.1 DUF4405 domain-containing protein [Noviherbaspirillum sp. UKPF54]
MRHRKQSLHHLPNGQRAVGLRIERWHRFCIYGVAAWLVATGALWLLAHYFLRPVTEFGEGVHPLEPWSMKLHGAGAMAALFFVGSLLNIHLRRAIKAGRNIVSGWSMIVFLAALSLSGYGLYYLASEQNRPLWSAAHWAVGLLFPGLLILHIVLGRKKSL